MRGVSVILHILTQSGVDAFNCPEYTETTETVDNVLIAPVGDAGQEVLDTTSLDGSKAVYVLGIPKSDAHTWEGNLVEFFGQTWRVIGKPTMGIDSLIPGPWNKKVRVESIVTEEADA